MGEPGRRILLYHGLDNIGEKKLNSRFLSAARFESQIQFLSQHTQIVSLDDYFLEKFDKQRFTVAITFDDGYRNNLHHALPVLEKYAAHATFFLTGAADHGATWLWMDFLDVVTRLAPPKIDVGGRLFYKKKWRRTQYFMDADGRRLVDWARHSPWSFVQKMEKAFIEAGAWERAETLSEYWALLSSPEIKQLTDSPYVSIGAHGYTHQDLAYLPLEEAIRELFDCKTVLEKISRKPVDALAYPFGAYTPALLDAAEKMGFTKQLAVDFIFPNDQADQRLRERLTINPYISQANQWLAVKHGRY
ncbi:MAG: polysaccharide deacetylase family protein [Saprospiraceae bacterium]|nr:polysaccharide deacetylase family protein [Saprospiraceae bacterium]